MSYQGTRGILFLSFKEIATRIQMKYTQSKWEASLAALPGGRGEDGCCCLVAKSCLTPCDPMGCM